ncbi:MAG: hypothetical protein KIT68_11680 [Phycisphaeraceae bacterium]|nr:hypothetical protein [Phycisphaeraceae bacterium]
MEPRTRSFDEILTGSPLLSGDIDAIRRAFPSAERRADLERLAEAVRVATAENDSVAETWRRLDALKETVVRLLRHGLGVP